MQQEAGHPTDELVEWAEVLGGDLLGGRSDFKPIDEVFPEFPARLNLSWSAAP